MEPKEKKVEYIELIYDLIFVYIIGRNNTLLHTLRNGFIDPADARSSQQYCMYCKKDGLRQGGKMPERRVRHPMWTGSKF